MNTITVTRGRLLHLCSGCLDSGLRIHPRTAGKTVLSIRPLIRAQAHLHGQLPLFPGHGGAFGFSTSSLKGEKKAQDKKRADPGVLDALQFYQSHDNSLHSLTNTIKSRVFSGPPKEGDIVAAFIACKKHARQKRTSANSNAKSSPTSAILTLDDTARSITLTDVKAEWTIPSTEATELSDLAYSIITHPAVFISEPVLAAYVDLAIFLRKITNLPAAFALYAKKPYIRPGSKQPSQTYPSLPKYAIPDEIASKALDAAISAKDMELALDIINTTYGAPAYRWNKIVRKAAPAGTAALLSPAAVYILAQQAAKYQDVVDHDLAAKYAFVGMLAYLGFTGSIGLVALTTSNDQMERVTWLVGTPLSKRWLYEDERAAYDKVAQGWGFDDPNMRGFEEGPQWELLREYIAGKSMILDNPTLMEGME